MHFGGSFIKFSFSGAALNNTDDVSMVVQSKCKGQKSSWIFGIMFVCSLFGLIGLGVLLGFRLSFSDPSFEVTTFTAVGERTSTSTSISKSFHT